MDTIAEPKTQAISEALNTQLDTGLIRLAREIAMDHYPLEDLLKRYGINQTDWIAIRRNGRFLQLLESEIIAWQAATNTHERTRYKAAAMMENFLEEANDRLHDNSLTLTAKVELAKLIARIAGMGIEKVGVLADEGSKFTVNINLGADNNLKFEKNITSKVISQEAMDL